MGCHTWFYKKVNGPTLQEAVDKLTQEYEGEIEFLENYKGTDFTPEEIKRSKEYFINEMSQIESGCLLDSQIFEKYTSSDLSFEILVYAENKGFYLSSDELPHDLFRKYGYPETRLFSLEETLSYIHDKDNECFVYDYTEESLKKFWKEYPDGMIEFG